MTGKGELVLFFRNNHFLTLTRNKEALFSLVTDIGYTLERLVVWDLLSEVHGDSRFTDGDFVAMEQMKRKEIMDTALLYDFKRSDVDEAIPAVSKPNEELKIDDVLAWLYQNKQHY